MEGSIPIQNHNAHLVVVVCLPLRRLAWSPDQSMHLGHALLMMSTSSPNPSQRTLNHRLHCRGPILVVQFLVPKGTISVVGCLLRVQD
jgi:hypothetical protein